MGNVPFKVKLVLSVLAGAAGLSGFYHLVVSIFKVIFEAFVHHWKY